MQWTALALCLACSLGQAQASLVRFDDIHTAVAARLSDGYQSFNRFNVAGQNRATGGSAGLVNARVAPADAPIYAAFIHSGPTAMLLGAQLPPGSPPSPVANDFVFYSAYFTAVYLHGLNIHLTGYLDGAPAYLQTTIADADAARLSDPSGKADTLFARGGVGADNLGIHEMFEPGPSALPGPGIGSLAWSLPRAR
ncbi:hypothetical protein os1_39550 [Comamonadaceae bacterium OS-1]|nr:hypothetical protein os1_39550 [Comamonadaceae bacterium OS-1]